MWGTACAKFSDGQTHSEAGDSLCREPKGAGARDRWVPDDWPGQPVLEKLSGWLPGGHKT